MGCFFAFLLIPLAPAFCGLAVAGNLGFAAARFFRDADDCASVRDRALGFAGMTSPGLVLVAMCHGVDGVPLAILAVACLATALIAFGVLFRRVRLDLGP